MALSIVVVSWNTCQLLADCLSSIEDTRGTLPVEVVVVDNASTDGSADMVAGQYPAALLLRNETNVGFAAGNNQGFRAASGKYVLMLNSDTVVHAGALRSMVAALETNGSIGIVGPRVLNPDGTVQPSCTRSPTPWRDTVHLLHLDGPLRGLYYQADRWPAEQPREVDTVLGACLMVRREALEACGGLHEGYFMYSEEVEFCECVRAAGWRVLWLPQATVTHFGGASTQQVPDDMFLALYASKARFYRRNRSTVSRWLFKLGLLIASVPRAASLLLTPVVPAGARPNWTARGRRYSRLLAALPTL